MLAVTIAVGFAWWAVSDVMAGRVQARTVLIWIVLLLAAVGGSKLFSFVRDLLGSGAG